jgi:hypothetical protein
MLLTTTSDLIQLVTGSAGNVDIVAEYADLASGVVSTGRLLTKTTTATTTTIVASPAASTARKVKELQIANNHATTANSVTIQQFDGTNTVVIETINLLAGERIGYREASGYTLVGADGVDKPSGLLTSLVRVLDADATGTNVATAQQWFPTSGAVAVAAATTYKMTGLLALIRAAGTTSHTTGLLFAGTATLTGIQYVAESNTGDVDTTLAAGLTTSRVATNTTVKAASTSATETALIAVRGIVRVNAAGTFIPQFIYSAAPGGAPTIKANSYFQLEPLGSGAMTALGTWT